MVFGFPLSDYDCGIKRFRIESPPRLSPLPLPCSARVACYDRLRDSAIRAAAAPTHRAAVPYCVGAGVPDGPLLVPFMPLAGIFRAPARHSFARGGKRMQKRRQKPMVFGFPLSDYDCGIKRFRIESPPRLSPLPLPCSARVACYDRLRDSAIRAAAAPVFRAAVRWLIGGVLACRPAKYASQQRVFFIFRGPTGRTCTCRRWRQVRDLIIAQIGRTANFLCPPRQRQRGQAHGRFPAEPFPAASKSDKGNPKTIGFWRRFCPLLPLLAKVGRSGERNVPALGGAEPSPAAVGRNGAAGGRDENSRSLYPLQLPDRKIRYVVKNRPFTQPWARGSAATH